MDPNISLLIKTVETAISDAARERTASFLGVVLKEPGRVIGSILGDRLRARQYRNLISIVLQAQKLQKAAGLNPKQVPLSIIHPTLEAASFEESADLQKIWANLLANAASQHVPSILAPSFPAILKEFSANDVKFLDTLYASALRKCKGRRRGVGTIEAVTFDLKALSRVLAEAGLRKHVRPKTQDSKSRKGLKDDGMSDLQALSFTMGLLMRHGIVLEIRDGSSKHGSPYFGLNYALTHFGVCFITACRPPEATVR